MADTARVPTEDNDSLEEVSDTVLRAVLEHLEYGRIDEIRAVVNDLSPTGVAYLLEQVHPEARTQLVGILKRDLDPETLVELDDAVRDEVLEAMEPRDIV